MSTEAAWTNFIYRIEEDDYFYPLLSLARTAAQDEILNKLYPFTTHHMIGLSSTQVYGYPCGKPPTVNLPHATAQSFHAPKYKPLATYGMYVDWYKWPGRTRKIADGESEDIVAIWRCLQSQHDNEKSTT